MLGETRTYSFERITSAIRLIDDGARFIATNPDPTGPSAEGPLPATGSVAALISRATGVEPYFVGKPNPLMMRSALNAIDAHSETTAMIGDRMDTDIVAGLEAGLETILVLTGVTARRRPSASRSARRGSSTRSPTWPTSWASDEGRRRCYLHHATLRRARGGAGPRSRRPRRSSWSSAATSRPAPLPVEMLYRLARLGDRVRWVMGNADRELVSAYDGGVRPEDCEDPIERLDAWVAQRLSREHRDLLASFEPVVRAEVDGLGPVLFCHGSPRSDNEIITALSPPERLAPMFDGVAEDVVVCGHTHHQFDRAECGKRVLNAGSVGMPYEDEPAAYWLWLGPDAEPPRTDYDVAAAAARMRASGSTGPR